MKIERHLSAALGYIKLGMLDEAIEELEGVEPEQRARPEVLGVWVEVFAAAGKWHEMQRIALHLTTIQPDNAQWWLHLAFATRRIESVEAAREILLQAERYHPGEPTIQFNLGCYACSLGEFDAAKKYVLRSIQRVRGFRQLALKDSDLKPLWDELAEVA
jgi:tetratricopeptide (TPR) repeat protein